MDNYGDERDERDNYQEVVIECSRCGNQNSENNWNYRNGCPSCGCKEGHEV